MEGTDNGVVHSTVTFVKPVQPAKAHHPIEVTELGIEADVRFPQECQRRVA